MTSLNTPHLGLILIVDEGTVPINAEIIHLEACGYEVMTAGDGPSATQLIAVRPPDIIISDIHIPAMGGNAFFRHLTKRWPEIPVIVTATPDRISEAMDYLRKGACDFLVKPMDNLTVLSHAVGKSLREIKLKKQNQTYRHLIEKHLAHNAEKLKTANRYLTELNRRLTDVVISSKRLSSCVTIESFGTRLLQEFSHHLDAAGGSLYIAGQEGLRLVHCLDGSHAPNIIAYPVEKSSPFGCALRQREPLLIGNIQHERTMRPSGFEGYRNGSFVIFPLQTQSGQPFGLVSIHSKRTPPFINQDCEVGGLLASYSSETLRAVRAMEALTKSEEKYRIAALTASDLISEWSPDTDEVVWLGDIDAVIGSAPQTRPTTMGAWISLIHPDDRERMAATYRSQGDCATASTVNYRIKHLAHGWRHFSERTTTIKAKNGGSKVLRACNDITREKNAEEERIKFELRMQHAQKLESLGIIAGGIAHDFNNILMAVLGHADIAQEEIGENPVAKKSIGNIITAGKRATELAQQLLVYSGKGEVKIHAIDINQLVSEMMNLIQVSISKKVHTSFRPGTHTPPVRGNQSQLRQVILNLLTNASQAIGNTSGKVFLTTGKIFCTHNDLSAYSMPTRPGVDLPLPETTYTFIDIEDTGCGMDETTKEKLFDPFYTTKKTGTGLGMAAVLGILRQHRGTMTIESAPGKGTRIRVLLPSAAPALKTHKKPALESKPMPMPHNGGLILIADDEDPVRKISQRMVEKLGFSVITACDGNEAVAIYEDRQHEIQGVILDMTMPGLNGREALDRIQRINPSVKAIIASGYGSSPSESADGEHPPSRCGYLQKPYQIAELRQVLQKILDPTGTLSPK